MKEVVWEKLSESAQQFKKEELTVRLVVLTFIGGIYHAILIFVLYWQTIVESLIASQEGTLQIALLTAPWYSTIVYLTSLFLYSLIISSVFKEKRIISPILVQTVSAGTSFAIAATGFFLLGGSIPQDSFLLRTGIQMLFLWYIFFTFSFFINRIIRRLTGYNGSREDLHELTVILGFPYGKFAKMLTDRIFLETNGLEQAPLDNDEDAKVTIVRSQKGINPKVTIAISPDVDDANATVVAFCSYELKYNSMTKSNSALQHLKNNKGAVYELIREILPTFSEKKVDHTLPTSNIAAWESLRITRSAISSLQKPRYGILGIIAATITIGVIMTFAVFQNAQTQPDQVVDYNSIITIWTAILAILATAGVSMVIDQRKGIRKN